MPVDPSKRHQLREDFSVLALAIGAIVSIFVTVVVCIWEWVENPGGIFHNAVGTNWQFVLETATSWLIPTFVNTVVLTLIGRLMWLIVAALKTKIWKNQD